MGKGRSLVVFSCYEYKNVLGVPPYNEIAMTIPIMVNPILNTPILPMVAPKLFKGFGYYCFSMPVTSLENQIRGRKIWGLPKVVQEINIKTEKNFSHTIAHEESGESYFELKVPMEGSPTNFDVSANLYSLLDNQFLQSETAFKGAFKINKHMDRLFKTGGTPEMEYLKIGKGPSGEVLRNLEIDPNPFQFRYTGDMSSCFDLPNTKFHSPLNF